MPLTLSFGRSIADVSVTGSVTSKPSTHSADSCGRVPPMRSSPSGPRTTDGSSGSDCRMRGRGSGRRDASCAVMRLPSVSIAAPDDVSTDATTVVDSVACADFEHDARRAADRNMSGLEAVEHQVDDVVGGAFDRERAVGAGHRRRHDRGSARDFDLDAWQRQARLIDDDAAGGLGEGEGREAQDDQRECEPPVKCHCRRCYTAVRPCAP